MLSHALSIKFVMFSDNKVKHLFPYLFLIAMLKNPSTIKFLNIKNFFKVISRLLTYEKRRSFIQPVYLLLFSNSWIFKNM